MTTRGKRLVAVLVALAGTVADIESTIWARGRGAVELNPIMRLALHGGRPVVYTFRLAVAAFVYRRAGAAGLLGLGIVGLALAANNVVQAKAGQWFFRS